MTIRRIDTARSHRYEDQSGKVPGVTTIMGDGVPKPALINWAANTTADYAVNNWADLDAMPPAARLAALKGARYAERDAAANKGTQVHAYAEQLMAGHEVQVPDDLAGHVEAYARFLDEFRVKPVLVEFVVYSHKHRYAGTADSVLDIWDPMALRYVRWLTDIKTNRSGIYGETALQLAGYRYADSWLVDGVETTPLEVERCGAIHVRGDGYNLIPVTAGLEQHRALLYVQQVAQFVTNSRDLVGDPIIPPTTSTYRLTRETAK